MSPKYLLYLKKKRHSALLDLEGKISDVPTFLMTCDPRIPIPKQIQMSPRSLGLLQNSLHPGFKDN